MATVGVQRVNMSLITNFKDTLRVKDGLKEIRSIATAPGAVLRGGVAPVRTLPPLWPPNETDCKVRATKVRVCEVLSRSRVT